MVNVNIPISDELHKKIKLQAVMQDQTLKDYIIKALEEEVNQ